MNIYQKPPFTYQYIVGLANLIERATTPVTFTNSTGGDVNLQRVTIVPGAFVQDGQKVSLFGVGSAVNASGTPTIGLKLNDSAVFSFLKSASGTPSGWRIESELMRAGADLVITSKAEYAFELTAATLSTPLRRQNKFTLGGFNFAEQQINLAFFTNIAVAGDSVTQNTSHLYIL